MGCLYCRTSCEISAQEHCSKILIQGRLADSIAKAGYLVVLPDLFKGDAIPLQTPERGLNLTEWFSRHPTAEIDSIIESTIKYIRTELGSKKVGGVGYCLGGKYVPRFLAEGKGLDAGFIAHPSNLELLEIQAIAHPISMAAGGMSSLQVACAELPLMRSRTRRRF